MTKVLMAMSGGVDSTVAAYLLKKKGYEVLGLTMRLYPPSPKKIVGKNGELDINKIELTEEEKLAKDMARNLGIEFHLIDLSDRFEDKVIQPFIRSYERGRTPNPCVFCNKHLKFGALFSYAKLYGCDFIATGHYASVEKEQGKYILKRGQDRSKDQSYMLFQMTQEELSKVIFPLGDFSKEEVRSLAEEAGLKVWNRPDSEDICFIPEGDYIKFLESFQGKKYGPGKLVDENGKVLGKGKSPIAYTIGQRRGLGLAMPYPVYVLDKNMDSEEIVVGKEDRLFFKEIFCPDWNWMSGQRPEEAVDAQVKIRYLAREAPCTISSLGPRPDSKEPSLDQVKITFDQPQRAPAPGQSAVAYDGDLVLGGGTIDKILDKEE